jgi:hypothetical protein
MTQAPHTPPEPLCHEEQQLLRAVAGSMIPASPELGLPGADEPAIFAEILAIADRDPVAVREPLRLLQELSGGSFVALDASRQAALAAAFRERHPDPFLALVSITVRCYYRHDRVMRSLGMEPRPPFPLGFEVEQGDWTLLDPVRARGPIFRDAP